MPTRLFRILTLSLLLAGRCWANDLPDACGDANIHFNVKTEDNRALPARTPGQAQLVFIESVDQDFCLGCNAIITRVGVDGAWVGANKANSYFVSEVSPGKHEVCADWQRVLNLKVHVISLTAEGGKTYFILTRVTNRRSKLGDEEMRDEKVRLYLLGDAEGRRLLAESVRGIASVYR